MTRTTWGRRLYAMGGNPEAARRIGISIGACQALAYGYLGLMAGVAGLLQAHRVGESVPNALVGGELNVLAAAVLDAGLRSSATRCEVVAANQALL
eukprot:gene61465-84076_t